MQRKELGVWRHGVYIIIIFNITIYYNYIPLLHGPRRPRHTVALFLQMQMQMQMQKKCKELPIDQDKILYDGGWERMTILFTSPQ